MPSRVSVFIFLSPGAYLSHGVGRVTVSISFRKHCFQLFPPSKGTVASDTVGRLLGRSCRTEPGHHAQSSPGGLRSVAPGIRDPEEGAGTTVSRSEDGA